MTGRRAIPSTPLLAGLLTVALAMLSTITLASDTTEECLECHGEEGFERDEGKPGDLYVDPKVFRASIHGDTSCDECHEDAVLEDGEHPSDLAPVDCGTCHDEAAEQFGQSLHGQALAKGDALAPHCYDCHTRHAVFAASDARSTTYKLNQPATCSRCHRQGTEMTTARVLSQTEVVEQYTESIHGEGLFKRGLIVSAVCSDCHGTHLVLPHEDPRSSISRDQVPKTCMRCHAEIERVHKKVIRGELWEKQPHVIPACVDCHQPHAIRRVFYEEQYKDDECLRCHAEGAPPAPLVVGGEPLVAPKMAPALLLGSAHGKIACIKCHAKIAELGHPPGREAGTVDCSACHAEEGQIFATSEHALALRQGYEGAPDCKACHGTHGVLPRKQVESPTYPLNVPTLCGRCHSPGGAATTRPGGARATVVPEYTQSIHGMGLAQSGLVVTATCTSCHTAHGTLAPEDPRSTVHPSNLPKTCGACHHGVAEELALSIHGGLKTPDGRTLPTCDDCHSSHRIRRTEGQEFRQEVLQECGRCHADVTEGYFETYHGKVSLLGYGKTAKCSDCHGAHAILPPSDPRSTLSRANVVATCGKCHPGSHRQFAGYLSHATHHDRVKYPILFYAFWGMTILLLGTLGFFGLHTLLWMPRSFRELFRHRKRHAAEPAALWIQRFPTYHRVTHVLVIVSFLTLVTTGMTLKFAYTAWAQALARALGGFESAGMLHRLAAIVTFVYFAMHLTFLFRERRRQGARWRDFLFGPHSLAPNRRDLKEFGATVKWFLGLGPQPAYGKWTYWEKFDYLAVFWGVAIIGATGLMLWFPETFTYVLPGWAINVATIIHSDEALLATAFIFTIHFFNTHFRPEKFPMDPVIFTGRVRLDDFKEERPREYERLVAEGRLESMLVPPPTAVARRLGLAFGLTALAIGLALIGLIVYSMVFIYR